MSSPEENFIYFCGKDLIQLSKEPDNGDQAHLLRRTTTQFHHEAYKIDRRQPKASIFMNLDEDIDEYSMISTKILSKQFNTFAERNSVNVKKNWSCALSVSSLIEDFGLRRKKKENVYLSDEVNDEDIGKLFNAFESSQEDLILDTIKNSSSNDQIIENKSNKTLTFTLPFNRIKNQNEHQDIHHGQTNFLSNLKSFHNDRLIDGSFQVNDDRNAKEGRYEQQSTEFNKKRRWICCDSDAVGNRFHNSRTDSNRSLDVNQNEQQEFNAKRYVTDFRSGNDELQSRHEKKYGTNAAGTSSNSRKSLGGRRTVQSQYVPPFAQPQQNQKQQNIDNTETSDIDDRLKHIDPKMVELIRSEIMDRFSPISWDDIAGLEYAKTIIKEAVILPSLRPDIFKGLRRPARGILLFGPPGTGKTLIGKCIASQSESTFFSISASSLTSKWIGDGEKMVRALFAVAVVHQPAVIFIDEIDSLLCQRSENEHESSRRIKTEFLVQLDGAATGENERILIVGATNRPQELDEAARRRLVKRLYIPLPELTARTQILINLLKCERSDLTVEQINEIGRLTEGFSGADMKVLCHEAAMEPIRSIPHWQMNNVNVNDVRAVNYNDFSIALQRVRSSVSSNDLKHYIEWNKTYGSGFNQ